MLTTDLNIILIIYRLYQLRISYFVNLFSLEIRRIYELAEFIIINHQMMKKNDQSSFIDDWFI